MKWRSTLFVAACLLLLGSFTHAATPEVSSTQISTAQLPFCVADLGGLQSQAWNAASLDRNATLSGLICGSCSDIICRGATAGERCGSAGLGKHCDQVDSCSDGSYFCACLANNN